MISRKIVAAILATSCLLFVTVRCHALTPREIDRQQWLKWSQAERTTFVEGWIWGVLYGKSDGCVSGLQLLGETAKVPDNYGNRCFGELPKSLTTGTLVSQVTAFYQRYSENQGKRATDILEGLVIGRTIENIHERR
jgi:hypothetical protein